MEQVARASRRVPALFIRSVRSVLDPARSHGTDATNSEEIVPFREGGEVFNMSIDLYLISYFSREVHLIHSVPYIPPLRLLFPS